jgi:hypothetical protein
MIVDTGTPNCKAHPTNGGETLFHHHIITTSLFYTRQISSNNGTLCNSNRDGKPDA